MAFRWFDSIGGNNIIIYSIFVCWLLAVREDSEQHNAHHGKAWHQVRAPEWATRRNENENDNDNGNGNGNDNDNEKSVKSVVSDVEKKQQKTQKAQKER